MIDFISFFYAFQYLYIMNKIVEIFTSWKSVYKHSKEQNEVAIKRLSICMKCEYKVEIPFMTCSKCGCPLKAKVYSPKQNPCPLEKW